MLPSPWAFYSARSAALDVLRNSEIGLRKNRLDIFRGDSSSATTVYGADLRMEEKEHEGKIRE
jgi:hypothetical protein